MSLCKTLMEALALEISFMHFVQENDAGKLFWYVGPASWVSLVGR